MKKISKSGAVVNNGDLSSSFGETEKVKLLQIVFVGQPEFEIQLDSEHLRQLKQRIVMRRTIPPLTEKKIIEYIEHRLKLVGSSTSDVFTAEGNLMYNFTIPRSSVNLISPEEYENQQY